MGCPVLGIRVPGIVQYLYLRTGLIGLPVFWVFVNPPENTAITPFGNLPFNGKLKISKGIAAYQVVI